MPPTPLLAVRFLTAPYRRSVPLTTISTCRPPTVGARAGRANPAWLPRPHNARPFRRGRVDLMAAPHSALLGLWRGALMAIAVLPLVAHIAPLPETYRSAAGSTRE